MPTKSRKIWLATALLLGLALRPSGAVTKSNDLRIRDFSGHWVGVSVDENGLGSGVRAGPRDLDFALRRQGEGFRICWTTPSEAGQHDATPTEWRFVFERVETPGTWQAVETGSAVTTRRGVWANLRGRTLTIFGIITREDGFSGMQIYERTLDHKAGMSLEFARADRDLVQRNLSGRLMRAEDLAKQREAQLLPYESDPGEPPRAFVPDTPRPDPNSCGAG